MSEQPQVALLVKRLEKRLAKMRKNMKGLAVGSFGIPYAAIHEFGFDGQVQVKAHQRKISKAFGRPLKKGAKIVDVRAHTARRRVRARPYIRPAVKTHQAKIMDILREAVMSEAPTIDRALLRIGNILKVQMSRNIRSQGLIDRSGLLNSIEYELI